MNKKHIIVLLVMLLGISIALLVYNLNLKDKLKKLSNTNQKVVSIKIKIN